MRHLKYIEAMKKVVRFILWLLMATVVSMAFWGMMILSISGCGRTRVTHSYSFPSLWVFAIGLGIVLFAVSYIVRPPRR